MHYTLIVVVRDSEDVDDLMAPYGSEYSVVPHWGKPVSKDEKEEFCLYYKVELKDFDKTYEEYGEDWNGNIWRKDRNGVWKYWITWNDYTTWDWYEVGGRWPGRLQLKKNAKSTPEVSFSWGWSQEEQDKFLKEHPRCTDIARKGDVANLKKLTSYSLLIDREWIDVEDETNPDCLVYDHLKDLPNDVTLVCIDYHN